MMEYLSIKEFANAVNMTQQNIYKQLKGRLKPYVKEIDGKKYLSQDAIQLFNNSFNNRLNEEKQANSSGCVIEQDEVFKQLNTVNLVVEMLQKELDRKDALLLEERKRVDELNKQLVDAYKQISEMGQKAQYITGVSETNKLMDKQQERAQEPTEREQESAEPTATPPKKIIDKLFSWLNK